MKKLKKGIQKIEKLDIKQRELEKNADAILSSSGVGQAPPVYHTTLDKIIEITKKKAKIWNEIRSIIIPFTKKTLWQMAVQSKNLPIVFWGEEQHLDFYAEDIKKIIQIA